MSKGPTVKFADDWWFQLSRDEQFEYTSFDLALNATTGALSAELSGYASHIRAEMAKLRSRAKARSRRARLTAQV